MKVLLVSSSPRGRNSSTYTLSQSVLRGILDSGIKAQIVHLAEKRIGFCRHNERCHKKILDCPTKDDTRGVLEKMIEADGIIFATPNYISQVTASMKALFDRSSHFIHCKRLLGKYTAAVVCSGSKDGKDILQYLKYYSNICGAQFTGGVAATERTVRQSMRKAYLLGRRLAADIKDRKDYPVQKKAIKASKAHFKLLILRRKNDWKQEYQYWRRMGWL